MPKDVLPAESLERLSVHDHACLFWDAPGERLSVLVPYFRSGLSRGEKCLLYCSPGTANEILSELRDKGVDIGNALARGAVLVTQGPRGEDFDPERVVAFFEAAARLAVSEKYAALRLCVDMAFILGKAPRRDRLTEYQRRLAALLASRECLCLCLHGRREFSADVHLDALRAHPLVIVGGNLVDNAYHVPPSADPATVAAEDVFRERLAHLADQHLRLARHRRQALRLSHLRDVTVSLLDRGAVPDLLKRVAEGIVSLGYRMCWIGMARPDGSVEPVAVCGDREGYLLENAVRWDDTPLGNGPTGAAIRKARPDVVRDVARSQRFAPWRESTLARGYHSVIAIPLRGGDPTAGALTVYASERNAFNKEAIEELMAFVLQASLVLRSAQEHETLSRSEARLRLLFEQLPVACFTFDREGTVGHWNMNCRKLFGHSPARALGRSMFDLIGLPKGEDKFGELLSRVFAGESVFNLEWQTLTAAGEARWVLSNMYPFYGAGDALEMGICASVDVTAAVEARRALAESEVRFRAVVEHANVFVVEIDADGKIVLFNPAAERITGYASRDVVGREYFSLFVPERERAQVVASFRNALGGKDVEGYVNPVLTRDGTERFLSWNARAVGEGAPLCVVAVGVDVTERLRAERNREELRKKLVQTQKMEAIGSIAGGIAHEFNNILAAIIGHSSLLEARLAAGDPSIPAVLKIRRSAERAAELTTKLLGFARRGKNVVRPLSLNDVVSNTVTLLFSGLDARYEILTRLDPALAAVEGDETQLQHSLLNLCNNARDAMPAGGRLAIETGNVRLTGEEARRYHVGAEGDYVFLEVRDTGEGMTDEVQGRIFEPFFTTRQESGKSGMGLPMVYGIVKNHGGGIHVESAPGRGSTVRIYLPATVRAEPAREAPPPTAIPKGSETILVVDDEEAIREMGKEILTALGYRALLAENGEAALRICGERGGEIALVILDIIMPKMGGQETFRRLRRLDPSLPILLSSGYTVEGLAQEILNEGANGFIQKPYGISKLARTIRGILDAGRRVAAAGNDNA